MEGQRLGETRNRNLWRRKEFYFGTWNVLSLYQAGALRNLLDQIDKFKIGITMIYPRESSLASQEESAPEGDPGCVG
jgi:hypothetical protein